MDRLHLYAIWDRETGVLDTPYFAVNDVMAKRRFMLMVNENETLKKWPQQFDLWHLGYVKIDIDPVDAVELIVEQDLSFQMSATQSMEIKVNEDSNGA